MKLRFVSSFNEEGYRLYGRRFTETFLLNMPHESELLIYSESDPAPWELPGDSRLKLLNLKELPSFEALHTIYNSLAIFQRDYRYAAGKFFPKVWSLIGASVEYDGILCWVDADTEWSGFLSPAFIEGCLDGKDLAVMSRNRWHLCSSFLIIDLLTPGAKVFLKTLADMYGRGEVLLLGEWHDAFAVESIIKGLEVRGELRVSPITTLFKLPCPPGPHNIFDEVFRGVARHFKGALKAAPASPTNPIAQSALSALARGEEHSALVTQNIASNHPARYAQLTELARSLKPRTFLEFGTWQGERAIEVAQASPGLEYVGIDLFETGTPARDRAELNVKPRVTASRVAQRLAAHKDILHTVMLFAGDSTRLDPEFVTEYTAKAELIFIDGGHSLATIASDLKHAFLFRKPGGVIVMDDYYTETEPGFTDKWGCNKILEAMGVDYEVLPLKDPLAQGGTVQMVIVRGESAPPETYYSYAYIVGQRAMHEAYPSYGRTAAKWGARARSLVERYRPATILDYGCGKGALKAQLNGFEGRLEEYDPGIEGKGAPPAPADLVFCIDVLEHIEPEHLRAVLNHIRSLTRQAVFFTIATREARKCLPDGRNTHLILKSAGEWERLVSQHFGVIAEVATDVTERGEVVLLGEP
jgi:predicted O-methyltransferase YrrM